MAFSINYEIELGLNSSKVYMSNEPNNKWVKYYQSGDILENEYQQINMGNYEVLNPEEDELGIYGEKWVKEPQRFTKSKITDFGIKTLVGYGAYGFFLDASGKKGRVKVPIVRKNNNNPPVLLLAVEEDTIIYNIQNTESSLYECFRLSFTQDGYRYDFITYDPNGEIIKIPGMYGEFEVTCIGYRNEIQEYSKPTDIITIDIGKTSLDNEYEESYMI